MEENPIKNEIEVYAKAVGLAPSTICERAVGNTRLYKRLLAGGDCTYRVLARIRKYMKENPPPKKALH